MPTPINDDQIVAALRYAAMLQRNHSAITYEHGVEIVNLVAKWGDRLADALSAYEQSGGK